MRSLPSNCLILRLADALHYDDSKFVNGKPQTARSATYNIESGDVFDRSIWTSSPSDVDIL